MRYGLLRAAAVFICGLTAASHAAPASIPLYYQDPDGKPLYASTPIKTPDGRPYRPIFVDDAAPGTTPRPQEPAASPSLAPSSGDHRILYYRNPMGLPDTSPTPKKDAMGMDYLPVYADDATLGDPPGTVRISPDKIQTLGVETTTVEIQPAITRTVRATGIVQFDERRLATVTSRTTGWVEHLDVAAMGDPVRRGQDLAEIYSPDLAASEREYLIAAGMGGTLRGAALQRLQALGVPQAEIERLRRTGKPSDLVAITAPENGVVIDKPVQEGMQVQPGNALYKTADLSKMWLIAQVHEQALGIIQPGQKASVTFVAYPGRVFTGTVDFIYPELSADTRTDAVRIVLANQDSALRANMYADVQIQVPTGPVLAVPASAVIDNGVTQVVLIARGGGKFGPRRVQLGIHAGDQVQVLSGLEAGDKVVVGANFLIDAESNLRAALQSFAPKVKSPTPAKPDGASQ